MKTFAHPPYSFCDVQIQAAPRSRLVKVYRRRKRSDFTIPLERLAARAGGRENQ